VRSSAAACRRQTSSPAPSDGDRRPAISVTLPRLPGNGRLSVTSESTFNVLASAAEYYAEKRAHAAKWRMFKNTEIIIPWKDTYTSDGWRLKLIAIDNVPVKRH